MPRSLEQTASTLQQLEYIGHSIEVFAQSLCQHLQKTLQVPGVQICLPSENNMFMAGSGERVDESLFPRGDDSIFWPFISSMTRSSGFENATKTLSLVSTYTVICCRLANTIKDSSSLLILCDPNAIWLNEPEKLNMFATVLQNFWDVRNGEMTAHRVRRSIDDKYGQVLHQLQEETRKNQAMEQIAKGLASIATCRTEFGLLSQCVELVHEKLGLDRVAAFVVDPKNLCYHGVYGMSPEGAYQDERQDTYDFSRLPGPFAELLQDDSRILHIEENTTLYFCEQPVGYGWNGMVVMRFDGAVLGWFAMDNLNTQQPFNPLLTEALIVLATTVARVLVEIRQNSRVQLLARALSTMSKATTSAEVCRLAVEFGVEQLDMDRVGIFIPTNENATEFRGTYGIDTDGNLVDESYFTMTRPNTLLSKEAFERLNDLIVLEDVPLYHERRKIGIGWNSAIVIHINNQYVAMICADNLMRLRSLSAQQRELFQLFCQTVGELLSRVRSQESLVELNATLEQRIAERTRELRTVNEQLSLVAMQDSLTGIKNRRAYEEAIDNEWRRQERRQHPITLVILDLDGFKQVNDRYGHLAGDELLKLFAASLSNHFRRATEIIARLGGDEFAVVIQEQELPDIEAVVTALAGDLAHTDDPRFESASVSAGIAMMTPSAEASPDTLFSRADKALYQAKAEGKNRIVVFDESEF